MPQLSQCLHNCIKLYITCGLVLSTSFIFLLKNAIDLPAWLSTTPMPTCEESQSTSNTLSKYGKANIGVSVTFFFRI